MDSIGKQIVSDSMAALKESEGGKSLSGKRDLLSVLLKSNLSAEIPGSQRLSEAEIVAREEIDPSLAITS